MTSWKVSVLTEQEVEQPLKRVNRGKAADDGMAVDHLKEKTLY